MAGYVFQPRYNVFDGILLYRGGFKIRNSADVKTFINGIVKPGMEIVVTIERDVEIRFSKDRNGYFSVGYRTGNLRDVFNPTTEVANTNKVGCYKYSVEYYIWKWRKYLNNPLFRRDD